MFKYLCQKFKDGQVLTADCLNHMEEGIENACQTPGPQGPKGDDGVSISHEWDGTTLKITSASGTSSANLRGPTGPIGIKGNPGDPGKSAYEYARDGGYMGSETKFSEQLAELPEMEIISKYTANDSIVISEQTISSGMWSKRQMDIQLEIPYAVYINGTVYFCIAGEEDGGYYLGNPTLFYSKSTQPHNNEPFCIYCAGGTATAGMFYKDDTLSYPLTLKVNSATVTTEKKIPEKYLPDGVGGGGANIGVVASVGQTIVVEEVDADGKPTKWKAADYPAQEIEIIPQTTFTASYYSNFGCYKRDMSIYSLVVGRTYTVVFDGVTYSCTAKSFYLQGMFGVYIGNGVLLGDNTGEPFTLVTVPAMGDGCSCLVFDANEHTMGLTANFIEHFDSLNAFPYYIEVTGSGTNDDPYTCAETFADIVALYDSGREIKVKNRTAIDNSSVYGTEIFNLSVAYYDAGVLHQFWFVSPAALGSNRYLILMATEDGSIEMTDNLD